jgi:quinol monooxygenase YgiN
MIRMNCFFKAAEGRYDDALEAAIALTALSQQEDGCIAYDVFESATRGEIFMICETWTDEEALAAHMQTEHFKTYGAQMQECGELKIEKLNF